MTSGPMSELFRHRRLLWQMTVRDFKSKYAGSLMGVFWTVINPLLLLAVFTFIFTVVFKARFGERSEISVSALYILCGILPWLAFQDGLGRAGTVVIENRNLAGRARFPLSILPAFPAVSALLGQMAGFVVLILLAGLGLEKPGWSLALLPLLFLLQLMLTVGIAMLISSVSIYLRDVVHVLPVLLLVWFYGTPVFYPASLVPEKFQLLIALNPMALLIGAYRNVILEGAWPAPLNLASVLAYTVAAMIAGSLLYKRLAKGFADRL